MPLDEESFDGFWYRVEVLHFSIADDFGEHLRTETRAVAQRMAVVRETPKGVWLVPVYRHADNPERYFGADFDSLIFKPRLVLGHSRKAYASPTLAAARREAITRKEFHIKHSRARLSRAENDLLVLKHQPLG